MPSIPASSRPVVVFVTFPNAKLLDVTGPMQVFADARFAGGESYDLAIVSVDGGEQLTDTCVPLRTECMQRWQDRPIHTLLIAGGRGAPAAARDPDLVAGAAILANRAERVGSVCTGAYILAAAGLLNGCRAVTHWSACQDLAMRFPSITVEPDRIFIKDKVWTSAGVTAGIDMALAMVAEDSGRHAAMKLAKSLVTFMARPGGQSQFSTMLNRQTDDVSGRFDALHIWIANNLDSDLRVERLARQVGMSARNFARVYQSTTGYTPAKFVELIRVSAARDLLEDTKDPVFAIARKTGFVDGDRLRRAMKRVLGLSPRQCRERFGHREPEE